MTHAPLCVVAGAGPGNGHAIARRFLDEGYRVALLARRPNAHASLELARGFVCDLEDPESIRATFASIRSELGDPEVLVYNASPGVWGDIEELSDESFERAWRVNALGAFVASREVIPAMKAAGHGAIVLVGATASLRGMPKTAAFAPAKAAQRALAQSMARQLWPGGIHVALVIIDGIVDLPWLRAELPDRPDEFFVQPDAVANTVFHLAHQHESAWSFEVEARPYGERW